MILQISNTEWLMLKSAVLAPELFNARYTQQDRQALLNKLNKTFEEQSIISSPDMTKLVLSDKINIEEINK